MTDFEESLEEIAEYLNDSESMEERTVLRLKTEFGIPTSIGWNLIRAFGAAFYELRPVNKKKGAAFVRVFLERSLNLENSTSP